MWLGGRNVKMCAERRYRSARNAELICAWRTPKATHIVARAAHSMRGPTLASPSKRALERALELAGAKTAASKASQTNTCYGGDSSSNSNTQRVCRLSASTRLLCTRRSDLRALLALRLMASTGVFFGVASDTRSFRVFSGQVFSQNAGILWGCM